MRTFIYGGNNKKLYHDAKLPTSDEEMLKKIVIKNFKNIKDESPNIIDIDNETGEVRQISKDHDSLNFKNVSQQTSMKIMSTFLPNDYPNSVTPNYKTFTIASNVGAIAFTTMSFLSTQSLFVALGR
jgi:hypothetical protein